MARPIGGRLSEAFRETYQAAGLTQTDVAAAMQARGWDKVDQSLVSKWARGMARPSLDVLPDLDAVCGVPLGHILRAAGYVAADDAASVEDAVRSEKRISKSDRETLLGLHRFMLDRASANVAAK